jgi:hypothetical protein
MPFSGPSVVRDRLDRPAGNAAVTNAHRLRAATATATPPPSAAVQDRLRRIPVHWAAMAAEETASQSASIDEFWQWWLTARDRVARSIHAGGSDDLTADLNARVDAIDSGLEWETCPGSAAEHALVVTAAGKPQLRAAAARWLTAAPSADATWEYHATRPGDPSALTSALQIAGTTVDLTQVGYTIEVDRQRCQIDVVCYHPAFAQLPDEVQAQVTYLSLDWLLGEAAVEIWLGAIGWTSKAPEDLKGPTDLRHAVAAIDGDFRWILISGRDHDGVPRLATVAIPLRSARWPRFDTHVALTLDYSNYNEVQLPADRSLAALRAFEDQVTALLGQDGTLVAHETARRQRTFHFYVDSSTTGRGCLEEATSTWREGPATAIAILDPGFDSVRHLIP